MLLRVAYSYYGAATEEIGKTMAVLNLIRSYCTTLRKTIMKQAI
jgi:hypothetical protein